MSTVFYRIDTGQAVFGVRAKDDKVIETAPTERWSIGRDINEVLKHYREKKNASVVASGEREDETRVHNGRGELQAN